MYLYNNLQKIITLDRYYEQKGPPHITAINYASHQQNKQTPSANAFGVQSLTTFHSASGYGSQQNKRFTLLSEYFYKPPRVLAINDKIKTIAMGCIDIADPENNNNGVDFFLKISLFLGMTTASYYFLYFWRKT